MISTFFASFCDFMSSLSISNSFSFVTYNWLHSLISFQHVLFAWFIDSAFCEKLDNVQIFSSYIFSMYCLLLFENGFMYAYKTKLVVLVQLEDHSVDTDKNEMTLIFLNHQSSVISVLTYEKSLHKNIVRFALFYFINVSLSI